MSENGHFSGQSPQTYEEVLVQHPDMHPHLRSHVERLSAESRPAGNPEHSPTQPEADNTPIQPSSARIEAPTKDGHIVYDFDSESGSLQPQRYSAERALQESTPIDPLQLYRQFARILFDHSRPERPGPPTSPAQP